MVGPLSSSSQFGGGLTSLSNEAIIAMVGPEAFARGMVYARDGRVSEVDFDPDRLLVFGRVRGSNRASYATSVQLAGAANSTASVHHGRCSCPVAMDCKHAAALLIAARALEQISQHLGRGEWERIMGRLANGPDPRLARADTPLGLELDIEETPGYRGQPGLQVLRARPVRPGANGRWVRTGVGWDDLDHVASAYRADHGDVLMQLRTAAGSAARFSYPRNSWLVLTAASANFWSVLTRAREAGLALLPAAPLSGIVLDDASVQMTLDVRRDGGDLIIHPLSTRSGVPVAMSRVGLLGDPAHTVYWIADRVLALARLAQPVGGELRQLVNRRQSVVIPARDEARFVDDYLPQLRTRTPFVSSDGSVDLPAPVLPSLVCTVTFRPEHLVRLDWSASYPGRGGARRYALDDPPDRMSVRDLAAEQRIAYALSLPYPRLPSLRPADRSPGPAAHCLLAGRDAVLFVSEVLPTLAQQGVEVEILGEPVAYREASNPPEITVSAVADPDAADWFDLHIKVSVDGEILDFEQLFVALANDEPVLILDSGVCIELDRPQLSRLRDLIAESRALHDDDKPGQRISTFQASLWEDLVALGTVIEQSSEWAATVQGLLSVTEIEPVPVPASLRADLRPYQLEGYRWLAFLHDHGLGGILADDMGLGKTVQALAQVCRARELSPDGPPFLVVAPTSVISNWLREAERFAPGLRVVAVTETGARRKSELAGLVADADVVVTSYAILRIDVEQFATLSWSGLVLDEAQFVKNHRAKTYQCARRVRAPFKLAITGTPLENSLMDLWSLLSITAPGLFPHPERFSEFYRQPIERAKDTQLLAQLRRRIRPLMLRRTKEGVAAELPPKQEQVLEVVLQPKHQRIYQTHLQRERRKILGLVDDLDRNRFTILRSLTLLRQLALDVSLVDPEATGVPASKIDVLLDQLDELVQEGHRALVFSQFTGFLGKIKGRLDAAGIGYSYLDGRTKARARAIEDFTSGTNPVFLISLKAGGFGLNLTEADYCFVLDPWWNPATEAQAVDRAHRIGQTKTVMVYRLVAKDTIEEKVMELKARKEELFNAVLGGDALADTALTADEIRALISG